MNSVILMGRLTADPELQYGNGENSEYVRFQLAVDRNYKSKNPEAPTADFIPCTAFGKTAEFISNYFQKGSRILISGSIRVDSYMNRDNQRVYTTNVAVNNAEFCDSKGSNSGSNNGGGNAKNNSNRSNSKKNSRSSSDEFINVPEDAEDEGLPFN